MASRTRPHPSDGPRGSQPIESDSDDAVRSPLTAEELELFSREADSATRETFTPRLETPPFLKRTLMFLLIGGFGLLLFFFMLETAQAIDAILRRPAWIAWPVVALIFSAIGFVLFRLGVVLLRLRRLPKIRRGIGDPRKGNATEREALRRELLKQLNVVAKQEAETNSPLAVQAQQLIASADNTPSSAWLEQYSRTIQKALAEAAGRDVRKIALAAGVSAAFSPWRLLDTLIAFNASTEAANCVLRRFGIRPDSFVIVAFAFDTFLTTFFAAAVDEISEDLAKDLQERLGGEFTGNAIGYLGPKLAQGIGIAYFVRRLGRRMIRRLEPVRPIERY